MASTKIAEFEVGRPTEGTFAVVGKQRRTTRNGDAYLVLELSDSTGRIEARVWNDADYFDRNVHAGDRVVAVGKPSKYRDQLQFDVRRLTKAEGEFEESFVPAASRDLDELTGELDFLASEVTRPLLRKVIDGTWNGPLREQLLRSPATRADHHAYLGGLVEHSIAVATLCMAAADRHEHLDRELLLTAALVHDIGRARELQVAGSIEVGLDEGLQGHVLLGHELLLEAVGGSAAADKLAPHDWASLVHAVANHHGPADRCRTLEALTLHTANTLDARLGQRQQRRS
jgi:3'-5' exoribonuclease